MDFDDWDLLSDEGFLDFHEDARETNFSSNSAPISSTTVIDMNYFQNSRVIPLPLQFDYEQENSGEIPEEIIKLPIQTAKPDDHQIREAADHQDTVSQVFFKKLKENEFVDMKIEPPKSLNRGVLPQFEEIDRKSSDFEKDLEEEEESEIDKGDEVISSEEGLNVWKWAMTGIGALFSFGFAAATVSLIVLGNRHNKESSHKSRKQQLHFQFYTHNKRLKQVARRATRFNEAITVCRSAPVTTAHITIGGYYEGL